MIITHYAMLYFSHNMSVRCSINQENQTMKMCLFLFTFIFSTVHLISLCLESLLLLLIKLSYTFSPHSIYHKKVRKDIL